MEKIYAKLEKSRAYVRKNFPYLYPYAIHMKPHIRELPFKSMAVDEAWRLYIDPEQENSPDELFIFIYTHELLHLVLEHSERMRRFPIAIANTAADLAVNSLLRRMFKDGEEILKGKKYGFRFVTPDSYGFKWDLTAEEYAELLMQKKRRKKGRQGNGEEMLVTENEGSGVTGRKADFEIHDAEKIPQSRKETIRKQASQIAQKFAGDIPGNLLIHLEVKEEQPKVDWKQRLRRVVSKAKEPTILERDFHRQRRGLPPKIVVPSYQFKPTNEVGVIIDTSGSMSEKELEMALTELRGILETSCRVDVVCADTCLKGEPKPVRNVREIELEGGGGTDMVGAIKELLSFKRYDIVIVITDGYCDWDGIEDIVGTKIIVVVIGDKELELPVEVINIGGD